jgi:hypothetical protein
LDDDVEEDFDDELMQPQPRMGTQNHLESFINPAFKNLLLRTKQLPFTTLVQQRLLNNKPIFS